MLPRIKSEVVNSGEYMDFSCLNIGYVLYSLSDGAFTLDVISSSTGYLFSAIGSTDNKIVYSSIGSNRIRLTNNQRWTTRFIILN